MTPHYIIKWTVTASHIMIMHNLRCEQVFTLCPSQHKNTFHQSLSGLPRRLISVSQYRCHVKIASLWLAFWSSYIIGKHASQFSWGFCSIVKDCLAPKRCDWAYLCVLRITLQPTETSSLSFLTGETIFQWNVTLDHKTSLKSLGYFCSNCQKINCTCQNYRFYF